mgnify:CR=1 FL=1
MKINLNKTRKLRLYVTASLDAGKQLTLNSEQKHYLIKVMRCKSGDQFLVFNGCDGEWLAELTEENNQYFATVKQTVRPQTNDPSLTLVFSPLKNQNTNLIIQKATELGVSYLVPVQTERSIVPSFNLDKARKIAIEAAEQCERLTVPEISSMKKLSRWLEECANYNTVLVADETRISSTIQTVLI